jgi:hypothetical protein
MVLTQTGCTVEGKYTYDSGHLKGDLVGCNPDASLSGRWDEEPTRTGPNDAGPFVFRLSADGKSFEGNWRHDGDATWYPDLWRGSCTAGACLANGTQSPGPVGPGSPYDFLPAPERWNQPVEVGSFPPGDGTVVTSPQIGSRQRVADVDLSPMQTADVQDFAHELILAMRHRSRLGNLPQANLCVSEYIAKKALPENRDGLNLTTYPDRSRNYGKAERELIACLEAAALLAQRLTQERLRLHPQSESAGPPPSAHAAARRPCQTQVSGLKLHSLDRASGTGRYRLRPLSGRRGTQRLGALRLSCFAWSGGLTIRVRSRRGRSLRGLVGPRLRVGVYRSPTATGDGGLRAVFTR